MDRDQLYIWALDRADTYAYLGEHNHVAGNGSSFAGRPFLVVTCPNKADVDYLLGRLSSGLIMRSARSFPTAIEAADDAAEMCF